jgi:hypothetical protein
MIEREELRNGCSGVWQASVRLRFTGGVTPNNTTHCGYAGVFTPA